MSSETGQEQQLQTGQEAYHSRDGEGGAGSHLSGSEGQAGPAPSHVSREETIKGPWSAAEDDLLHRLVEHFGPRNWTLIGEEELFGRFICVDVDSTVNGSDSVSQVLLQLRACKDLSRVDSFCPLRLCVCRQF